MRVKSQVSSSDQTTNYETTNSKFHESFSQSDCFNTTTSTNKNCKTRSCYLGFGGFHFQDCFLYVYKIILELLN